MKFLLIPIILIFTECGSVVTPVILGSPNSTAPCIGNPILGQWIGSVVVNNQVDNLVFSENCTGTDSFCNSEFTFPETSLSNGDIVVTINSTIDSPSCSSAGEHICNFSISSDVLTINCGLGAVSLTRF